MWLIILFGVLVVFLYLKATKRNKYWTEKGITQVQPTIFIGNSGPLLFRKRAMAEMVQDFYNSCPEQRYVGMYQFLEPILLIRDPKLIKQIAVKDFDAFPDHKPFASDGIDPLWEKNLFAMRGIEKWHSLRGTLSPAFTSSKMRMMFSLMKDCAEQFTDYFLKQEGMVEVEMKEIFSRLTNDVIGSTAFGVTCNSLKDKENSFYLMGKDATDFTGIRSLKFFLYGISPTLMKLLNIGIYSKKVSTFFRNLIKETITAREEKGIVRPDIIHLLMEARKGRLKNEDQSNVIDSGFAVVQESKPIEMEKHQAVEITDDYITAQALIFFFAGFDTVSTLMSYLCYELAINPEIQKRLADEVVATLEECNETITYEALLGMKYLDMVISETLRKWSPAEFTDRVCVQDFTIEPKLSGEEPLHLDANTNCWIPIYAIHRDPKYYPNPEKFDPDRFSDENKGTIKPYTFLPFGAGPRSCLGSRFALLEIKLIMFELLCKFEITPVEKTQIPLVLSKGNFSMVTERGFWLGLKQK